MLESGFYNMDCMDAMREFPDNFFDLAVVDPPYGINIKPPKTYKAFDDSHTPDVAYFSELERVAKNQIIWGGNYFLDNLKSTEGMIVWDKKRRGLNFA